MKRSILLIIVLLLFCPAVSAADVLSQQSQLIHTDTLTDALPEDARAYMEQVPPEAVQDPLQKFWQIVTDGVRSALSHLKDAVKSCCGIILCILLCTVCKIFGSGKSDLAIGAAGSLGILSLCVTDVQSMMQMGTEAILELEVFSQALLPVMTASASASGAPSSGVAAHAGTVFFLHILITFLTKLLVPAVYLYIALAAADAVCASDMLSGVKKWMSGLMKSCLKLVLFVFSAYLSLTGILAGTADKLAVKAARLTVSSAVPVIGGMLSDATETVLSSAKLLKSSVGVFGMLSVLSIAILPFLRIGMNYLVLQLAAALSGIFGDKRLSSLVQTVSSAMGFILAGVSCSGVMMFLACICFMKVGSV